MDHIVFYVASCFISEQLKVRHNSHFYITLVRLSGRQGPREPDQGTYVSPIFCILLLAWWRSITCCTAIHGMSRSIVCYSVL